MKILHALQILRSSALSAAAAFPDWGLCCRRRLYNGMDTAMPQSPTTLRRENKAGTDQMSTCTARDTRSRRRPELDVATAAAQGVSRSAITDQDDLSVVLDAVHDPDGDEAARAMGVLVTRHAALVQYVAGRFGGMGLPMADLVSEANIGLMHAAERFDPGRGTKFSTYACYWITHYIRRALDCQAPIIRIPCGTVDGVRTVRRTCRDLRERLGREPSDREVARELGLSRKRVRALRASDVTVLDLERPGSGGARVEYPDRREQGPDNALMRKDAGRFLGELLARLGEREARVLSMYFGLGTCDAQTHACIGQELGVSGERIRQIQKHSLKRLKPLAVAHLDDLLPLFV